MPRRIDIDVRREQLAEAVWRTVRERGMSAVSVRTVAAAAGVAVGSLRHVFPTRAELLLFSAELTVRRATERVRATPATGDPRADATAVLAHMLPLTPDSRAELDVNIALVAEAPALPELAPIRDHAYRELGRLCTAVVASLAGRLPADAREDEARRLHALVDGLALHLLMEPEDADPAWALDALQAEVERLAGLGARG